MTLVILLLKSGLGGGRMMRRKEEGRKNDGIYYLGRRAIDLYPCPKIQAGIPFFRVTL